MNVAMTPLSRYELDLQKPEFFSDPSQAVAVNHLQRLFDDIVARSQLPQPSFFARLLGLSEKPATIKGLYFWGGVGRGKTYLMDTFFDCLPIERKLRVHFHRFMQRVHQDLTVLEGTANPLDKVAEGLAKEAQVICFDEFFVTDITDAMILGGLFERLFGMGVVLVATSNIIPDKLYDNGLQRQRFLPAIKLINENTEIVNVDGGVDYRLRTLQQAELYISPAGPLADTELQQIFEQLVPDIAGLEKGGVVEINGRNLVCHQTCEDVVWFEFDALCDGPRSQLDYIELAKLYHSVIVSNVPVLDVEKEEQARRFINLVDEFYDSGVKLILSAEPSLAGLYTGEKLRFEFERTTSRLIEMQSTEYLSRAHRA